LQKLADLYKKDIGSHRMENLEHDSPYLDNPRAEMLALIPLSVHRLLDVGCHTGQFGFSVKKKNNAEVWGVEPNPLTAKIASNYLDKVFDGNFSEEIDLPENYFDAISFNDVLEHMPDPWAALRLATKKLKRGGRVFISLPNLRHIDNLLHILRDKDFNYEPEGIRDKTHLRFFTKKSAPRILLGTGLKLVEIKGINEQWWTKSLIRRVAFRFFPNYLEDTKYPQYALVAELS
jgi:2-polyprenyl-3-methyl-5-hydroxy-6-metoxy-1,4-benzoquinol methylase